MSNETPKVAKPATSGVICPECGASSGAPRQYAGQPGWQYVCYRCNWHGTRQSSAEQAGDGARR